MAWLVGCAAFVCAFLLVIVFGRMGARGGFIGRLGGFLMWLLMWAMLYGIVIGIRALAIGGEPRFPW